MKVFTLRLVVIKNKTIPHHFLRGFLSPFLRSSQNQKSLSWANFVMKKEYFYGFQSPLSPAPRGEKKDIGVEVIQHP